MNDKEQLLKDFLAWCTEHDMSLAGYTKDGLLGTEVLRFLHDDDEQNVINDFLATQTK